MIVIVIETHFDLWINEFDNEMQTQQFLEINARTSKAESREGERERENERVFKLECIVSLTDRDYY